MSLLLAFPPAKEQPALQVGSLPNFLQDSFKQKRSEFISNKHPDIVFNYKNLQFEIYTYPFCLSESDWQ